MCGVVGIVSSSPVNQALYDALTVMQHRGQDAAGIVTWGKDGLCRRKSNGLVRDVFRHRHMMRLTGNVGIGHIRYPTAGGSRASEAQPFYVNSPYVVEWIPRAHCRLRGCGGAPVFVPRHPQLPFSVRHLGR